MQWSQWKPLGAPGGGFLGRPAVISRNPSFCNIYVRGSDNALWQRAYSIGGWGPWERHNDGGVIISEPALGSMGPDHEHIFARGGDDQVWQKWWTAAGGWSGWKPQGAPPGGFVGAPATISRSSAFCNIYVRGTDNALWQRAFSIDGWGPWERHNDGGVILSEPALGSMGPDHEHVFARGADDQVWQKWWAHQPMIDVNLILIAEDNFSLNDREKTAASLEITRQIYGKVGLDIGNVQWYQVSSAEAGALAVIDSQSEADDLTDDWTVANNALDVFVVRAMNGADGWSAVGGSCDKDATGMTGSVVSLNGSNANSGNTFAHEMGHYLGLDHIADPTNFIGNGGASSSNTDILPWQGETIKQHCFVYFA